MKRLTQHDFDQIASQANVSRSAILHMTTLSASGHPGGSMSSIDILLTLYAMIRHDFASPFMEDRDRIVVSNGHVSPAVYAALANHGYFNIDDAIAEFRLAGSYFEGHIERNLPGIEWTSGNLGQGLSAACGFALANKIKDIDARTFVLMGDGEQQKGQISEARRFAIKHALKNITAIIDYNQLQIGGSIHSVMPQNIKENWESDGWYVLEINGHDLQSIHDALFIAQETDQPVMLLANTVMGKGVSFMENKAKYHGSPLSADQLAAAVTELEMPYRLEEYRQLRKQKQEKGCLSFAALPAYKPSYDLGNAYVYDTDTDNRSAWGHAIADLAKINREHAQPIVVFDCDLQGSVKTNDFENVNPERFIQSGIMEHNTAVVSGALSTCGLSSWWADFGMFGIDEVYNMHRLNDINHANLRVVTTHVGIDVGEDGRTHQCIDYIGLIRNLYHFGLLCPADPNQTDRIIRRLANMPGNFAVTMGRSKLPIVRHTDGSPFYGGDYTFEYGKADLLRDGNHGCMLVTGTPIGRAVKVIDILRNEGIYIQLWYVSAPLMTDLQMLHKAVQTGIIFTVEDHNVHSGLGSIIANQLIDNQLSAKLIKFGVKDYPISGSSDDVYTWAELDTDSLVKKVKENIKQIL
jgi:transketolase